MKCPNCNETLLMSERMSVEIDYCPKCRGVWLDKGELDKLLDIAAQQMEQQKPNMQQLPSYKQEYYKEDYHKHHKEGYYPKKKKSFLSDFLDFD
jgi:Zn-finger nucleic acid-binding protein